MTAPELRPGTWDADAWRAVYEGNEYGLPASLAGWVVLDIGAHVGAFTLACLERGALYVFAYEACRANAEVLVRNTAGRPCVAVHAAVWPEAGELAYHPHADAAHTGGGGVALPGASSAACWGPAAEVVPAVAYDKLVRSIRQLYGRAPLLVKWDGEGAEWACLPGSQTLALGTRYVGEYHLQHPGGGGAERTDALAEAFAGAGLRFACGPPGPDGAGHFEAEVVR